MKNLHPIFQQIVSNWAPENHLSNNDWIKSDYCQECGGEGFVVVNHKENEIDQCEECERLHALELRADRLQDEMKGN